MVRVYERIRIRGARGENVVEALIDTGAEISLIPMALAKMIGAWRIGIDVPVVGVHGQKRSLPLAQIGIFFPSLGDKGGDFIAAVSDTEEMPIIGMDVLKPLGISIDTKDGSIFVKNEVWEAFKTLSALGVAFFVGVKILGELFGEN